MRRVSRDLGREAVGVHAEEAEVDRVRLAHPALEDGRAGGVDLAEAACLGEVADEVEHGRLEDVVVLGRAEAGREVSRGAEGGGEDRAEAVVRFQREGAEREPERGGGGARAAALQRDLAEVERVRCEVGVRRVVAVEPADDRVAEEDGAAAVGLEPVLVRIHHDRVRLGDGTEIVGRKPRQPGRLRT